MKYLKHGISLALACTIASLVYYKAHPNSPARTGLTTPSTTNQRPQLAVTGQRSPRLIAEVGHVYSYRFHYQASGSLDLAAALGHDGSGEPRQASTTTAAGTVELACLASGDRPSFVGRIILDSMAIQANGQALPAASGRAVRDLAVPFKVTVDAQIRSMKVAIPAETASMSANLLREILNAMQVDLPVAGDLPESWSVKAADANGEIAATYRLMSADDHVLKLNKTKAPLELLGQEDTPLSISGTEQIELDAKTGWLRNLTGDFVYDVKRGSSAIGHSETSADFLWSGESLSMPLWASEQSVSGQRFKELAMTAAEQDTAIDNQLHRQALGDATFDLLNAELAKADADQAVGREVDIHARARQINQLYAWLELHPEDASLYSARLAETPQNSETFTLLVGSLYQTGHHEAQLALVQALDTLSSNKPKTVNILAVSGLVAQPDVVLEDGVRKALATSHDPVVANTAALALGNMAGSLGNDSPRHKALVRDLTAYLENTSDLSSKNALIASLGGTMDPAVIPTLSGLTHAESGDLRGAAAAAMARIPHEHAIDEVIQVASTDSDESVRYAAVEGLYNARLSRPASNASLVAALDKEESVRVRASIVRTLWTHRALGGQADQRVRAAALGDGSAEVRKVARTLIVGHEALAEPDTP